MFDEFSPFGMLSFSADDTPAKKAYLSLQDSMGPAFQQPNADAILYADAMCLGAAQHQLDGAAAQRYPLQCTALIDAMEREYQIVPEHGATLNTRQLNLLAAETLQAGATETAIEAGLTSLLGADFLGWRALDPDNEIEIAAGDNRDIDWEICQGETNDTSFEAGAYVSCVAYNPDRNLWIALTNNASTSAHAYSLDSGRTWTHSALTALPAKVWNSACWSNVAGVNNFVAVCETSGTDYESVATNTAGSGTWTLVTAVQGAWKKVILAQGWCVAVGTNVAMRSLDSGVSWDPPATVAIGSHPWVSVAFGNNRFVAVATDGWISWTEDFDTWNPVNASVGAASDVAFGNGVFVVVGTSGTNITKWSVDGLSWTNCDMGGFDPAVYQICFCDGLFIIVDGQNYDVFTSEDGKTFTRSDFIGADGVLVPKQGWRGVGCKPNRMVLCGTNQTGGEPGVTFTARVLPVPRISPATTTIKHVTLSGPIMPGSQTVNYTSILTNGDPLKTDEYITVEPGKLGWQERVKITASSATTITATFRYPHTDGVRATTAPWPTWRSTKCHSLIFVTTGVTGNRTKLAKTNWFLRKVLPASWTWTVIPSVSPLTGYTLPLTIGSSEIGYTTIGGVLTTGH